MDRISRGDWSAHADADARLTLPRASTTLSVLLLGRRRARRGRNDLAQRSRRSQRSAKRRAFATAGLRPATRRWRDPQIQVAVSGAPLVFADLSTFCRAQRDVANARSSASSAHSARDPCRDLCARSVSQPRRAFCARWSGLGRPFAITRVSGLKRPIHRSTDSRITDSAISD
jgi:hypothetical protein